MRLMGDALLIGDNALSLSLNASPDTRDTRLDDVPGQITNNHVINHQHHPSFTTIQHRSTIVIIRLKRQDGKHLFQNLTEHPHLTRPVFTRSL